MTSLFGDGEFGCGAIERIAAYISKNEADKQSDTVYIGSGKSDRHIMTSFT